MSAPELPAKLARLVAGERLIVSPQELSEWAQFDESNLVRTCINANRVGFFDAFVAWIVDSAAPTDLAPCGSGKMKGSA